MEVGDQIIASSQRRRKNESYVKGSIIRIAVSNFLTYDQCTFRLHPKLNVIIGPNGTGKSSIVCAICLGLGGKTSILARAKELGDYIKHGCEKAVIEIELCNPPTDEIIRREIYLANSGKVTSVWSINDVTSTVKQVEELTNKLNIQLSNLCQFLPQERVADFAKMNKVDLLENTELAVCPASMHRDHEWLKEFRNKEKELVSKLADDKIFLDKLEQKNNRVAKEVQRYKERFNLVKYLQTLERKKAWTVYEQARIEFVRLKEAHLKLVKERKTADAKAQPLMSKRDVINEKISEIERNMKKKGEELKAIAQQTKKCHDKINDRDEELQEKWDEYKEREKDEQMRIKKVEQLKLQISGWKVELNQLEECDVQNDIDQLNHAIRSNVAAISQTEHDHAMISERKQRTHSDYKRCEVKIAGLKNMHKQRMEILRRRNRDCYNAIIWLRSNKSLFKSTIHEPMLLLLKTRKPSHAELIENHVAMRDLYAFVCEDVNDNQRFIHEVREKLNLRINVVKAPLNSDGSLIKSSSFKPQRSLDTLQRWGFMSYLRESIDAPDAVMAYLCKQYRIHEIPIGSEQTKQIVDEVTHSSGFSLFFIPTLSPNSPGCRYSVRRSKYSSSQVVGNSALRKAEYLSINVDPIEIQNAQLEMQGLLERLAEDNEKMKELAEERKKLEKKDNELKQKKKDFQVKKNLRKNLENKIMLKEKTVVDLENSAIDLQALKQGTAKATERVILKKKQLAVDFIDRIKNCVDVSVEKGISQVHYASCMKQRCAVEQEIHIIRLKNQEIIRAVERAEVEKNEAHERAKELLSQAKKKTGGNPDHLKDDFMKFPNDLAAIEAKIHEYQARLECCGETDPKAYEEFKTRNKEIEKLRHRMAQVSEDLQVKRDEMEIVKSRWLNPLKELIEKINSRFSRYFAKMGCAGEVDLHADNEGDFDKYGIRIRVKFRATSSLQELNPFRQSGGERSVATMLYLVALQNLYVCPFRLVDEINQGMDPNNERRVFEVIVNTSSEETTSQYFLITPKLLPQLTYNRAMTIHCVYNGEQMLQHNQWKLTRFVRRRKMLKYEDE